MVDYLKLIEETETEDPITLHHKRNLFEGGAVHNKDGSVSTVRTIQVDFDGTPTLIPTVWDGQILSDSEAAQRAIDSGVQWPTAKTHEELRAKDIEIHANFDNDLVAAMKRPGVTPEQYRASREQGLPPRLVQDKEPDYYEMITGAPMTAKMRAETGIEDPGMWDLENAIAALTFDPRRVFSGLGQTLRLNMEKRALGMQAGAADSGGAFSIIAPPMTGEQAQAMMLSKEDQEEGLKDAMARTLEIDQEIARITPKNMSEFEEGLRSAGISFSEQLPMMLLSLGSKSIAPMMAGIGAQVAPMSYGEARAAGKDVLSSASFGTMQTGVEILTELLPTKYLVDLAKPGLQPFMKFAISDLGGEQLAALGETLVSVSHGLDEEMERAETWEQKFDIQMRRQTVALWATIAQGGAQATAAAGFRKAAQLMSAKAQSQAELDEMEEVFGAAGSSLLRVGDPQTFKQQIKNLQARYGQEQSIYVDAKIAEEVLVDAPPELAGVVDQAASAAITGGDVLIPMDTYLAHIVDTDYHQALSEHIRMTPDGLSRAEIASGVVETEADSLMQEAIEKAEQRMSAQRVEENVASMLVENGTMSSEEARNAARLWGAYVTTKAEQNGTTPEEEFNKIGLQITRPDGSQEGLRLDQSQIGLHSAVEKAAESLNIPNWGAKPVNGPQAYKKIANTDGVKKEELEWMGLEEFMSGPVTKEQVMEFIDNNGVVVEETVADEIVSENEEEISWDEYQYDFEEWEDSGYIQDRIDEEISELLRYDDHWARDTLTSWIEDNIEDVRAIYEHSMPTEDLAALTDDDFINNDVPGYNVYEDIGESFSQDEDVRDEFYKDLEQAYLDNPAYRYTYDANGTEYEIRGQNDTDYSLYINGRYSDRMMDVYSESEAQIQAQQVMMENGDFTAYDEDNEMQARWSEYVEEGYDNYREIKLTLPEVEDDFYNETHFPDRNIVAFLRVTDRHIDDDGAYTEFYSKNKMFFIDEMQSDWHQQGREEGYEGLFTNEQIEDAHVNLIEAKTAHEKAVKSFDDEDAPERQLALENIRAARAEYNKMIGAVPNAPFKKDAWMHLAMRRALVMAAERGDKYFGWADAQMNIDRWSSRYSTAYTMQYDKKMPSFIKKATGQKPEHFEDDRMWRIELTPEVRQRILGEGFPLFQDGERASVNVLDDAFIVKLGEASDLSSFFHESAHIFLEMEKRASVNESTKDHQKILDWLEIESFDQLGVDQHEKWARGFEAYLYEGKAPSTELRGVFRRFTQWMRQVYRSIRQLNVDLNPEIRGVMDRLLATEEEIEAAHADKDYQQFFRDAKSAGMTEEEWADYLERQRKSKDKANETLQTKILGELRRTTEKWWKKELKEEVASAREELVESRPYKASETIKGRIESDVPVKMDREAVKDMVGNIPPSMRNMTVEGGEDPDYVAQSFGYNNSAEMFTDFINMPSLTEASKLLGEQRMLEKHGDILNDGRLEQQAQEAAHNEERGRVILQELRALKKKAGQSSGIDANMLRASAKSLIDRTPVKDLNPNHYRAAEIRAAKNAQKALDEGQDASTFKAQQAANFYLWREATDALEKTEKIRTRLKGMQDRKYKGKQVDPEYILKLKAYLAAYDFTKNGARVKSPQALKNIQQWIESQKLGTYDHLLDQAADNALTGFKEVTFSELEGIDKMARHLRFIGGKRSELEKAKLETRVAKLAQSIRDNERKVGRGERSTWVREATASVLLHADSILRELDGFKYGEAYSAIKREIDDAVSQKLIPMQQEAGERLSKMYADHYTFSEMRNNNKEQMVAGRSMSKWQMISLALNWGNEGNRTAILKSRVGSQMQWTESQVQEVLDQLDQRDWNFVKAVWKEVDSYWSQIAEVERNRNGVIPTKVEALPFKTKYGNVPGGYFPLTYDKSNSSEVQIDEATEFRDQVIQGRMTKASTRDSMVKERVGSGGRPVLLEMDVVHRHINKAIQFIALTEPVANAQAVLSSKGLKEAMEDINRPEMTKSLDRWLRDTASGEMILGDSLSEFFRHIRTGFSAMSLGWNVSTVLVQPLGLFQSMPVVGYKNTLKGMAAVLKGARAGSNQAIIDVQRMSPFMRERAITFNKDITDTLDALHGDPSKPSFIPEWMRRSYFGGIVWTQRFVDASTWLAEYERAKSEFDNEADLINAADRAVARSQASGVWSDRTPVERGTITDSERQSEFVRMWTALGSYFFAKGNIARERTAQTNFKSPKEVGQYAADMTFLFALETLVMAALHGTLPDEEDDESALGFAIRETGHTALSTIPFVRAISGGIKGFGSGSSYGAFVGDMSNAANQIYQGELDESLFRSLAKMAGWRYKLPTNQLFRTTSAAVNDLQGEDVSTLDYLIWNEHEDD